MKIVLVHDFLTYWGGAEQVLSCFHRLWPEAPIYTLFYDQNFVKKYFPKANIKASFLQKFPGYFKKNKKYLLPLMPTAPETFDLREYDLVLSSSSSFAKGIIVRPKTIHISYCHAPTRFLWDWYHNYLNEQKLGFLTRKILLPILHYFRMWDWSAAQRVDYFIANSLFTAERIKKYYNRPSIVIYPPVDTDKFKVQNGFYKKRMPENVIARSPESFDFAQDKLRRRTVARRSRSKPVSFLQNVSVGIDERDSSLRSEQAPQSRGNLLDYGIASLPLDKLGVARNDRMKDYYLIVSRLSPYKKIDIAIEAFNKLGFSLIVIGQGSEEKYLKKIAGPAIKFLGFVPESNLIGYYRNARALIFPGEDDFGITIVEAMTCGVPVLALRKGGALETIREGETGEFFDESIPELLADGVRRLEKNYKNYDRAKIIEFAQKFSHSRFEKEIINFVNSKSEKRLTN